MGLQTEIAREVGQHAENYPWEDCTKSEQDTSYRSAKFIIAKMREVVKGAELTVPESVEVRMEYNRLKLYLPQGEAKELRWDSYLAKAQTQAVLKAMDEESK